MTAVNLAQAGAASLGVSALVALVVFYISYGLDRSAGTRTRFALLLVMLTIGIGYSIEWWIEVNGSPTTVAITLAVLRFGLAVTLLNFAFAAYTEGKADGPPADRPPLPMN